MEISDKTKITVSIGSIAAAVAALWAIFDWEMTLAADVKANSQAVYTVGKSLRLTSLADQIGDLKRERRNTRKELIEAGHHDNDALVAEYQQDLDEIEDEIVALEKIYECVVNDKEPCS